LALVERAGAVVIACGLALDVRFITALSIVPLAAALSSRVLYSHAAYTIAVYESTLTVLQLGLLAAACALLAPRLAERWARHVRIIGQLAFIWVNVAFWVGSLWGDVVGTYLWGPRLEDFMAADQTGKARDMGAAMEAFREAEAAFRESALVISVDVYSLVWAALILAVGAWAASTGRRPVFNTAVTFGAIHLYTQWFERLEATPGMVTLAGLIAIAAAYAIWRINLWLRDRAAAA
jgi:MFS-type transporter involved in bile tolerance (Atg22 family)